MRPSEKGVEEWGEVIELSRETGPIVFHFKPTKYLKVAPERLKDWEKFFAENVGLRPDKDLIGMHPDETISGSNDDWDDCDYYP